MIIDLLLNLGLEMNFEDKWNRPDLGVPFLSFRVEMLKLLLEHCALLTPTPAALSPKPRNPQPPRRKLTLLSLRPPGTEGLIEKEFKTKAQPLHPDPRVEGLGYPDPRV